MGADTDTHCAGCLQLAKQLRECLAARDRERNYRELAGKALDRSFAVACIYLVGSDAEALKAIFGAFTR